MTEKKKDLLAKISVPLHISADFLFDDKVSKDKQNALVRIILNKKNGLNPDQQDVLLASLNGVQKALESFADTVVTVFGVKTEQAA